MMTAFFNMALLLASAILLIWLQGQPLNKTNQNLTDKTSSPTPEAVEAEVITVAPPEAPLASPPQLSPAQAVGKPTPTKLNNFAPVTPLALSKPETQVASIAVIPTPKPQQPLVQNALNHLPDFSKIQDVKEKKRQFFNYLLPMVQEENQRILQQRQRLFALQSQPTSWNDNDHQWLQQLADEYRISTQEDQTLSAKDLQELLLRVDVVPPSLALAQAANESAWGTSRFARTANNLYGQWCFKKGCGLVPDGRSADGKHEVARFSSPQASVKSYIRNINTHWAYEQLRSIREQIRAEGQFPQGLHLSEGLKKYSQRGEAYVKELKNMILSNALHELDKSLEDNLP